MDVVSENEVGASQVIEELASNKASLKMGWPEITWATTGEWMASEMGLLVMLENCFKLMIIYQAKWCSKWLFSLESISKLFICNFGRLSKICVCMYCNPYFVNRDSMEAIYWQKVLNETNFLFVWSTVFVELLSTVSAAKWQMSAHRWHSVLCSLQ